MLYSARAALVIASLAAAACGPNSSGNTNDGGGGDRCETGETRSCYSADPSTQNVGICAGGQQTCVADNTWGACAGEITPTGETCGNSIDDNCNGATDEDVDADGDGVTTCGGDCCDSPSDGCGDPTLVGPGAFEAPGNMVDDDCDGMTDNVAAANCDTGLASSSGDGFDYAKAIELCERATAQDTKWGVITATFARADGTGSPDDGARSIRPAFGATTVQSGASLAVLSTGRAAATGQTSPNFAAFQTGRNNNTESGFPADWFTANNNNIPNAPNCPEPDQTAAYDPIMLTLTVRVPTNAKSFKLRTNFFSSEYPEWTCSPFNDFFVVLLDSTYTGASPNPADKNLAIYTSAANTIYPVGVNLAHGDTGLFTVCTNGPTGCTGQATDGTISTCTSNAELVNTGYCGTNNQVGGGTGWLTTSGNVVGGEVITLRIAIWDTSDHILDSVVLLDHFEWSIEASQPGTVIL
jgi:Putative metal-binding motif